MPILGGLVLIIQFCFAFHALKTGRPYWWMFVIMGFPVGGCLLYYFIEVFPSSRERYKAQKAVRSIIKSFDPEKDLRAAVADLEACGSIENRMTLARECIEHKLYAEAATLYRSCLTGPHENDPDIRYGLANALSLEGRHDEAIAAAQRLSASHPTFRAAEVGLILAKSLEGAGRLDDALEELQTLADAYSGEEARWRYGALLKRLGRTDDAQAVFERMLKNAERQPGHYRDAQKEWLALARQNAQV
jgi:hypothetical protein